MNFSVTGIIKCYHCFDREFWLSYKALEAVMDSVSWESIKLSLLKSKRIDDKYLALIDKDQYELKRAELNADWRQKNEEAKATGISVHDMIRNELVTNLFNARNEFQLLGEVDSSDRFLTSTSGIFPEQKLEITLGDTTIIGIADLIQIHDGVFDIIDWKTDEDGIKFKSHFDVSKKHSKKMKYPLSKLDDVNGIQYQLQLSIYAWMLKQLRPDLKVGKLKICLIKDLKLKRVYEVEYLDKDIEKLIAWHIKNEKLKEETNKCRQLKFK